MSLLSSSVTHGSSPRASKTESQVISANNISALISPSIARSLWLAHHLQNLLDSTTLFFLNAYLLSALLIQYSIQFSRFAIVASKYLLISGHYIMKLAVLPSLAAMMALIKIGWKRTEATRKKFYYEMALMFLNPFAVALFVFWPGWIPLGLAWTAWQYMS